MGMSYDEKIALSRKIMMAGIVSLLTATILIILLHLYAKYYLLMRQERMRRGEEEPRRLFFRTDVVVPVDDQVAGDSCLIHKAGLDALIIASLPMFAYDDRMNEGDEAVDCSVCLSAVCAKDMVRLLPNCKHLFHLECIDKWLVLHSTCPICRTAVEPRAAEVRSSSQVEAGSASVAAEEQGGSSSLLSSFRKFVSGERSVSRVSNDEESQ